jgi:hypothetical protein
MQKKSWARSSDERFGEFYDFFVPSCLPKGTPVEVLIIIFKAGAHPCHHNFDCSRHLIAAMEGMIMMMIY